MPWEVKYPYSSGVLNTVRLRWHCTSLGLPFLRIKLACLFVIKGRASLHFTHRRNCSRTAHGWEKLPLGETPRTMSLLLIRVGSLHQNLNTHTQKLRATPKVLQPPRPPFNQDGHFPLKAEHTPLWSSKTKQACLGVQEEFNMYACKTRRLLPWVRLDNFPEFRTLSSVSSVQG